MDDPLSEELFIRLPSCDPSSTYLRIRILEFANLNQLHRFAGFKLHGKAHSAPVWANAIWP
jgi:hypothetical protein